MKAKKRATGFKYIYETANPDVAVVRFSGEGVAGEWDAEDDGLRT